jgi:PLD-like domain
MRDLVPFAAILIDMGGGVERALSWTSTLLIAGAIGLPKSEITPDELIYLDREVRRLGLVDGAGSPTRDRIVELLLVLEVIGALPPPKKPLPRHEPLVFTLPAPLMAKLTPPERLDVLVADVIRSAESELRIGGPFWNADGMEILRAVLQPAIEVRRAKCVFYAHRQGEPMDQLVSSFVGELRQLGPVELWWYKPTDQSLLHAKFCVADGKTGYFGTANLTSWGLGGHVEIGVRLSQPQCGELIRVLDLLAESHLLERQ